MFQDSRGDYWFVSHQDGLCKYDGTTFTYYAEEEGLPPVRAMYEDSEGNMYFGIQDGLRILEGKEIRHINPEKRSLSLAESFTYDATSYIADWEVERNHFWFSAFNRNGLYRYDGEKLQHINLPVPEGYPDFSNTEGWLDGHGYDIYAVYGIYQDPEGIMWIGTSRAGLFRYDGKSLKWVNEAYEKGVVRASLKDAKGVLWFGNNSIGLSQYTKDRIINFTEARNMEEDGPASALALKEDKEGNIWIATFTKGLWKYNPSLDTIPNAPLKKNSPQLQHFGKDDGLETDHISSLLIDREGVLWIGTGIGGIFRYNGKAFEKLE